MADWIKVNHRLARSAKIRQLANELRVKKHAALGAAICWLIWVDEQTTDGKTGLSPEDVDDELGFRGLAAALQSIGWASMEAGCLVATDFDKHCGATAKKRAEDSRRQSEKRARDKKQSRITGDNCHGKSVTNVTESTLPEKNRIEDNKKGGIVTTGDIKGAEVQAEPQPPHHARMDGGERRAYCAWLQSMCAAVPILRRLKPDHPLPGKAEEEALKAYSQLELTPADIDMLRRYYEAPEEEIQTYRPNGIEFFFRDLADVLGHAERWCRKDDVAAAKAARAERRKAEAKAEERRHQQAAAGMTHDEVMAYWHGLQQQKGGKA